MFCYGCAYVSKVSYLEYLNYKFSPPTFLVIKVNNYDNDMNLRTS